LEDRNTGAVYTALTYQRPRRKSFNS